MDVLDQRGQSVEVPQAAAAHEAGEESGQVGFKVSWYRALGNNVEEDIL